VGTKPRDIAGGVRAKASGKKKNKEHFKTTLKPISEGQEDDSSCAGSQPRDTSSTAVSTTAADGDHKPLANASSSGTQDIIA